MSAIVETHLRTLTKTVLYRVLAIISVMLITLAFGGTGAQAGAMGLWVLIGGTLIYYIHDRVWLLFGWKQEQGDDKIARSIVKTVIYRIIIMIIAFIAAKIVVTDSNSTAAAFTAAQMIVNLLLYYIIERVFNRISWGKVPAASEEL